MHSSDSSDELGIDNEGFSDELGYSDGGKRQRKPPPTLLESPRRWLHRQLKDITQFYNASVTRFLYNTVCSFEKNIRLIQIINVEEHKCLLISLDILCGIPTCIQ